MFFHLTKSPLILKKITVGENDITDARGIANSLNSYFTSIGENLISTQNFTPSTSNNCPDLTDDLRDSCFQFEPVTVADISKRLKSLKTCTATGHDNIPAKVVKIASNGIADSVTSLVNSSLFSGIFPDKWKIARVSPLFKGNPASDRDNFRPISVLASLLRRQLSSPSSGRGRLGN